MEQGHVMVMCSIKGTWLEMVPPTLAPLLSAAFVTGKAHSKNSALYHLYDHIVQENYRKGHI